MPTLNELLSINMSYEDILENLEEQTDNFTLPEGEVAFDDQYEAEVAISILKNHYEKVDNAGIDTLNEAKDSAFVIKFSSPYVDDFDFPKEEEVEEALNESHTVKNKLSDSELKKKLINVTGFDNYNNKISTTLKSKREYDSKLEDAYYLSVSTLSSSIKGAKNKLDSAVEKIISYMKKLGYTLEYSGDYKVWDIARNTTKFTYDYQRKNARASKQLVFSKNQKEIEKPKINIPNEIEDTGYGWKSDASDIEFVSDEEMYDYYG